jgi:hypothetical protein
MLPKHIGSFLPVVLAACAFASHGQASLIGTIVDGGMFFHDDPLDNNFDPADCGSGTTAVIGAMSPTFETCVDGEDFNLSADFSASELDINFVPYRGPYVPFEGFQLIFEDPAFDGLTLSLLSFGGPFSSTADFSYSLVGDTLTFNVIDGLLATGFNDPYLASLSLTSTPEPSPIALVPVGLFAVLLVVRRPKLREQSVVHSQ